MKRRDCDETEEKQGGKAIPQVIADLYEVKEKIGSGGGGIVYLGRHLRLEKQIVLKADRRTLSAKPEALRREVDMLKGLSHTYIPQVYDFVQQDGVVYTVMDFIEGESLDKLLKRGQIPSQPQVLKWACELLEALIYLHSRPPHGILHGDIKPANIMLRSSGDICLIDYNIALALGENGSVRVGHSRGYASPEHYGSGNSPVGSFGLSGFDAGAVRAETADLTEAEVGEEETEAAQDSKPKETEAADTRQRAGCFGGAGTGNVGSSQPSKLDVRSDIYSLGATLYHLLSGKRPAERAGEVIPLGVDICSPAVSAIIQKAMAPSQDQRYQTAQEMLEAVRSLAKRDPRAVRHRRRKWEAAGLLFAVFLASGACAFVGLKKMEQLQEALALAEYSAGRLEQGDVSGAVDLAMEALPQKEGLFEPPVTANAQKALTDALGVYDLLDGFRDADVMELPSAPLKFSVSPEGSRFAALYSGEAAIYNWESGQEPVTVSMSKSALSDLIFLDETNIIYAGETGVTAMDLEEERVLWTGEEASVLALSGDGTRTAALRADKLGAVIYDTETGKLIGERNFDGNRFPAPVNEIFADPGGSLFALNFDGSMLAVSLEGGGLFIYDLEDPEGDLIVYEESEYDRIEGGFCGRYLAFAADGEDPSLFGLIDTEEAFFAGGLESQDPFLVDASERGIFLANGSLLVELDAETLEERELAYTGNVLITGFFVGEDHVLAATEDGRFSFYDGAAALMSSVECETQPDFVCLGNGYGVIGNRNEPSLRILELESHEEAQLLSYDARYVHDEARISGDGQTVMLFDYQRFRIYEMDGTVAAEVELPDPEYVYDQQFEKSDDGSWLEVIWYNGMVRRYSAADGTLLSEEEGEPPDEELYEEFYTDQYRIASPLHGTPEVFLLETGEKVGNLGSEDYLTYVTQTDAGLVTEYVNSSGERYGLLLNEQLEVLAKLPGLCDIWGEIAVFDDEAGNLRQCRLYSLQELMALGEVYQKENKEGDA